MGAACRAAGLVANMLTKSKVKKRVEIFIGFRISIYRYGTLNSLEWIKRTI